MSDRTAGRIYETLDFSKFVIRQDNRLVDDRHVDKLVKDIQERGLSNPIVVTQQMEITDGQHRYTACKKLGVPVKYIFSNRKSTADLKKDNALTLKWTSKHSLDSIRNLSDKHLEFHSFISKQIHITGLPQNSITHLMFGKPLKDKNANLFVENLTPEIMRRTEYYISRVVYLKELNVSKIFSSYPFCNAFYLLCQAGADVDRLVNNLAASEKISTIQARPTKPNAISLLIEVYNHFKKKNRITIDDVNNAKPKVGQYK